MKRPQSAPEKARFSGKEFFPPWNYLRARGCGQPRVAARSAAAALHEPKGGGCGVRLGWHRLATTQQRDRCPGQNQKESNCGFSTLGAAENSTKIPAKNTKRPPPLLPLFRERGGVYFEAPAAEILIPPPAIRPAPLEGHFQGWGECVHKNFPLKNLCDFCSSDVDISPSWDWRNLLKNPVAVLFVRGGSRFSS